MHKGIQNRHTIAWIGDHANLRIRHQSKYTGCIKKKETLEINRIVKI